MRKWAAAFVVGMATVCGAAHADSTDSNAEAPPKRAVGAIAAIENVVFEPDEKSATRVRILGAFRLFQGGDDEYAPAAVGYMYFYCPPGQELACRNQWRAFANAARGLHCVGFGWDDPPGVVRAPDAAVTPPDAYLLLNGMHRIEEETDERCADVLRARRNAYKPPAKPLELEWADVPHPPKAPPAKPTWYGNQTLIADGLSVGSFFVGASADKSGAVSTAGFLGFLLAPPIIHWAHGHTGRGFMSLGLRVGGVTAIAYGAYLATRYSYSSDDTVSRSYRDESIGALLGVGGFFTLVSAIAVDGAISYDQPPPTKSGMTFQPAPFLAKGGGGLGLSGTF